MFNMNKIKRLEAENNRLRKLVFQLTDNLIKSNKQRCKLLGIDYDSL